MNNLLATCAAIAVAAVVMLPGVAGAAERTADGLRNAEQIEVSSQQHYRRYNNSRRYYGRSYRRAYARPYYRTYDDQSYYARPAYGYGYSRGPGWGPAPFPFVLGLPY